jgi:hypothetical protein
MDTNNVRMFKSPRIINCNYENEGQLIPFSTLINTRGTAFDGYFISVAKYTNSILLCSFTHDSFKYTCWGGHITIGKTNNIFNITSPIYSFQLQINAFVQQSTLIHFIGMLIQMVAGHQENHNYQYKYQLLYLIHHYLTSMMVLMTDNQSIHLQIQTLI